MAGRWALATTSLYPSTKIERLRRTQNRAPGGLFSLEFMLLWEGRFSVTLPPRNHLPTRGPTPPKSRFRGPCPTPAPKPAHRGDTAVTAVAPWLVPLCTLPHAVRFSREVGAGFRPQKAFGDRLRQAKCSACPTRGWVNTLPQPPDVLLQTQRKAKSYLPNFPVRSKTANLTCLPRRYGWPR